jgi:superfamily II DNA/RNA helicase
MGKNSWFRANIIPKPNKFKENLALIAFDEGHTIWDWSTFRVLFKLMSNLRLSFLSVPFAMLSATLPPHVISYAIDVLELKKPVRVITVDGRRSNIDILVAEQPPGRNIEPLCDLIKKDKAITSPKDIPKTLIFIDSVIAVILTARRLRRYLKKHMPSVVATDVIRTYYSSTDEVKKAETLKMIKSGEARIVLCTDSLSLGVDIRDIEIVVQWGVTGRLLLNSLVQRIGRAARDPKVQGVAVVFAPKAILHSVPRNWKEGWSGEAVEDPNIGDDEWEDMLDDSDFEGVIPNYQSRELSLYSLPVTEETSKEVEQLRSRMYRKATIMKRADEEARKEARGRKRGGKRTKKPAALTIEPGLLWFLCTCGCKQKQILSYMKYPDVHNDAAQKSWCCCSCAIAKGLDPYETQTAGISLAMSASLPWPRLGSRRTLIKLPPIHMKPEEFKRLEPALKEKVLQWRLYIVNKMVEEKGIMPGLPPASLVPDSIVTQLVASARRVTKAEDLDTVLTKAGVNVASSSLTPSSLRMLFKVLTKTIEVERAKTQSGTSLGVIFV